MEEITNLTVHELMDKIQNKELTSSQIVEAYKNRIGEKEKDVDTFITLTLDKAEEKAKADLNRKIEEIRGEKGVPNVIIKGTDEGTYTNLIDCLDEMQICDIGKYVIVPIDDFDKEMIEYYKKNGSKSSDSAQ